METILLLAALGILGLALIGLVTLVRSIGRALAPAVVPPPGIETLSRVQKLAVVHEVLGFRMPADVRVEYDHLRGWRPAPPPRPHLPQPALAAPPAAPPPAPLQIPAAAPSRWRPLLSLENAIFLLASCLVLGGTLYGVATTWGRVPAAWRYLFVEGVILFYGSGLLGLSRLLDRRLRLPAAARFLAVTAALTKVGGAIVACGAFHQSLAAGAIGTALAALGGAADAWAVGRPERAKRRASFLYAAALAAVAGAGALSAGGQSMVGGALALLAVLLGGPAWLSCFERPSLAPRALAAAFPVAAVLLVVAGWLPAACAAPAVVAAGATVAAADLLVPGVPAALVLVALQGVAFGLTGGHLGPLSVTLVVGLAVALALRERPFVSWVGAAWWCALAFSWARGAHLVAGTDAGAWASTGVGALPFAAVALVRRRPAFAAAGMTGLGALLLASLSFPHPGLPSVITAAGTGLLALACLVRARVHRDDRRWAVADLLALVAVLTAGYLWSPAHALALTASGALLLAILPGRAHRWVGTIALPIAISAATAAGASGLWLAGLSAAFGLLHLLRPMRSGGDARVTSLPLGPLALIAGLGLALLAPSGGHTPVLALHRWPLVLAAGLAPLVAWVAWRGGSTALAVEAAGGLLAVALGGQALPALVLATVLVLGRDVVALPLAALAVAPLTGLALAQHGWPEAIGGVLLVSSAVLLWRPLLSPSLAWLRRLGMPLAIAGVSIATLAPSPAHAPWLAAQLWPLVAAGLLIPFAVASWRGAAAVPAHDLLAAAGLLVAGALADGFAGGAAGGGALVGLGGGLVALACGVALAQRRIPRAAEAVWVFAFSTVPLLLMPVCGSPLSPAVAAAALGAMAALGLVSKRLGAPRAAAWALGAGLPAVWWLTCAVAQQLSTGQPPENVLPALAAVTALHGIVLVLDGHRLAAVGPIFQRRLAIVALALAGLLVAAGAVLIVEPRALEAALTVVALTFLATLALVLGFRERIGWPFPIAEAAVGVAYAYLRLRTPWLSGLGDWDGVVACAGGLACHGFEGWLRRARGGLGASESRWMAVALPSLSALLLRPSAPLTGLGPALGALFLTYLARDGARPAYAWLAALLFNLSLPALWFRLDVHSPVAYALPAGITLAVLAELTADTLGPRAGSLRTLAALVSFAATSWEMFRFASVWPAAVLALTAVAAVLAGIAFRVRAYPTLGMAALLLDIAVNLTRWGMHDRLVAAALGVSAGLALFALGTVVARHKEPAIARYRRVMALPW